jgi:hypothetical protein
MRWENMNLNERKFQIIAPKSRKLKIIAMDEDYFFEIVPLAKKIGRVFPWLNRSSTYSWLSPLCKKLDVSFGARKSRHKFASDLVSVGASEHDLVNNGSWTNTGSAKSYVTLDEGRAREMLKKKKQGVG